jgi:hypothetical protein
MHLEFQLPSQPAIQMDVNSLVIAGWTGRDTQAIEHHIEELQAIGVPRPSAIPLFYRVAVQQISQKSTIEVLGESTSGEVEPLLFVQGGEWFVSIASDHTDRQLETHSVALSKQICPKPVAVWAWRLDEVLAHWDQLQIRSWIEEDGAERLYQEGTLAALRPPADLLARFAAAAALPQDGFAMTCGTVPAIGGIRAALSFRMELTDPVLGRSISHRYSCAVLPVVA